MYKGVREFDEDEISPEALLAVVWDVARYPNFVRGVVAVNVLQDDGRHSLAEFKTTVTGLDFSYVLKLEREPDRVCWRRVSGAFRIVEGSMAHLGGTRFRYENALDPGFAVPGFAVRFVLERSLPRLIREFRKRAKLCVPGAQG